MWKQIFDWELFKKIALEDTTGNVITLVTFLAILLTHLCIRNPKNNPLGFSYWWYLLNAYFFHIYMEVLGGLYGYVKSTYYLYYMMDSRYYFQDNIIFFICWLEVFVMGPVCLVVAILYKTDRHVLRIVLSIVVSSVQFTGTILYFLVPVLNRFNDFYCNPTCFTFTPENLFFFWFGCCCTNPWWVIIPTKEILKGYRELKQLCNQSGSKPNQVSGKQKRN